MAGAPREPLLVSAVTADAEMRSGTVQEKEECGNLADSPTGVAKVKGHVALVNQVVRSQLH